jgi:sugar phosphate isomerase/epimerase
MRRPAPEHPISHPSRSEPASAERDRRLRLACADSTFPRLSHTTALAVIRDLGIDAVDVCVFAGYEHNPPEAVVAAPQRSADTIGARLDEHELHPSDVFAILGTSFEALAVNHPDEAIRVESMRQFEALVEFASRLKSPGITVLPGTTFDGVDDDESLTLAAAELEKRARLAGEAGLRFAIEPHFDSVVPTPARTLALLERTENVGLALDLSHFVYAGIAQEETYSLLGHTHHVHLRQAAPDAIQTRVREGIIDFPEFRDRLLANGYDGYFALEYQWEEGPPDFTHVDCITESVELRDLMLQR